VVRVGVVVVGNIVVVMVIVVDDRKVVDVVKYIFLHLGSLDSVQPE
jgi:hypothetical protein